MTAMICSQCGAGLSGNAAECGYCGTSFERKRSRPGRGRTPECPRCDQALSSKKVYRVNVAHCQRCSGLWVPHDAMHSLLTSNKRATKQLHSLNQSEKKFKTYRHRTGSVQRDVAPAHCPACDNTMRLESVTRDGIYLDVCDDHGTWFDRTELRALLDRGARESLRANAGGRNVRERERDSDDGVWGALGAIYLFGAIEDIVDDAFDFFD